MVLGAEATAMSCPDVSELERYATDATAADELSEIGEHIRTCSECSALLSEIGDNLRVVGRVREALLRDAVVTPPPAEVGPYRVLRELGRGGMGVVYLAEQRQPKRLVALKVLRPERASGALVARFEREASALAQLHHPGIAQVYESGVAGGNGHGCGGAAYIAMEYVRGRPLKTYLSEASPSVGERIELLAQICDAVHHAHVKGVVHRDLKPANILVVDGPDGAAAPKIVDFGVARLLELEAGSAAIETDHGQLLGTLPYMSPEQVAGDAAAVDARSDVFSLGVLAYEVLGGRRPHETAGRSWQEVARAVTEQSPPRLGRWDRRLRGDVETVVAHAMELEPERRYSSAAEMAADLRRCLRDEPIVARPASAWYQLAKLARRHRAAMLGAAACLALLVITTGAAVAQAVVATQQRDAAERRFGHARDAAAYLLSGVGSRIGGVLGAAEIDRHLAEETYAFYEKLAREAPADPAIILGRLGALYKLMRLSLAVGDAQRAVVLGETALRQIEPVRPLVAGDARLVETELNVYGVLAAAAGTLGDAAASERWRGLAAVLGERAAAEEPAFEGHAVGSLEFVEPVEITQLKRLLERQTGAAEAALAQKDGPAAAAHVAEALESLALLIDQDPRSDPLYRDDLPDYAPLAGPILIHAGSRFRYEGRRAGLLLLAAEAELLRGAADAAVERAQEAIEIAARQCRDRPMEIAPHAIAFRAQRQMAALLRSMDRPVAALEHALRAREHAARIVRGDRRNVSWQRALTAIDRLVAELRAAGGGP